MTRQASDALAAQTLMLLTMHSMICVLSTACAGRHEVIATCRTGLPHKFAGSHKLNQ